LTSTNAPTETVISSARAANRIIMALCVASLFAVLNFIAPTPFYPEMADDLDTTVSRLGQLVTVMVLISAVLGIAIGPLSDRYGYRWPLVGGMVAIGVNLIGIGVSPSFYPIIALGIFGGIADALVFGMPMAIAGARFDGEAQRKAISWTWGSFSSAGIIGVPVLTLIGEVAGWRAALVIAGLGAIAGAWFAAVSIPADPKRDVAAWHWHDLIDSYVPLLKHSPTLRLYGVSILRAACWIGLLTYLGSFLQDELGLSVRGAGLLYTVGGCGFAIGSVVAGRRFARISPRVLVALTCVVAGCSIGAMLLVAELWATMPLLFIAGFVSAISGVGIATILAVESPAGSGTTMVLNGSLLNLGTAIGAVTGGILIAVGGYTALGIGFPLFSFAGAALACWPATTSKLSYSTQSSD